MPKKKACGKLPHASRGAAEAAIAALVRRYPGVVFKRPYRCGRCKAWHITSTPRSGAVPGRVKH